MSDFIFIFINRNMLTYFIASSVTVIRSRFLAIHTGCYVPSVKWYRTYVTTVCSSMGKTCPSFSFFFRTFYAMSCGFSFVKQYFRSLWSVLNLVLELMPSSVQEQRLTGWGDFGFCIQPFLQLHRLKPAVYTYIPINIQMYSVLF